MTEQMTSAGVLVLCVGIVFFWLTIVALVGLHRSRSAARSPDRQGGQ